MHPRVNMTVRAANRAAEIIRQVWGFTAVEDGPWVRRADVAAVAAVLFDHARCPELAWKADAAAEDFHRIAAEDAQLRARSEEAEAAGDELALALIGPPILHYNTFDTDYDPNATEEQGVVKIWQVGSNSVTIVRDRWHDPLHRNREENTTRYAASLLGHMRSMHDYWDCTEYGCNHESCGLQCNINIAKACNGTTRLMPVARNPLILLFRCCRECEVLGGQIAANNYKRHVIEARADLPPGAVIDPGSPVPPLP